MWPFVPPLLASMSPDCRRHYAEPICVGDQIFAGRRPEVSVGMAGTLEVLVRELLVVITVHIFDALVFETNRAVRSCPKKSDTCFYAA